MSRPLTCVDLFAGAGGLSTGLTQAGFNVVGAVELERDACETYSKSHTHTECLDIPIEEADLRRFCGVDLVAGGPPCQPFSSGGKRKSHEDQRDMLPHYVDAVRTLRPRAFLLENVPGLITGPRAEYLDSILVQLQALGYTIGLQILNAAEYGVPQKRKRLFVVGVVRGYGPFLFPKATHGVSADKPFVSVGSVLAADKILGEPNGSQVFYAKRPDLRPSPYDGHLFNGGGRAINLAAPCHTILASAGGNKTHFLDTLELVPKYHRHLAKGGAPRAGALKGGRRLTVHESALIQTFPKQTKFCGSRSSQYKQVGNAVPPRLARVVGAAIRAAISQG